MYYVPSASRSTSLLALPTENWEPKAELAQYGTTTGISACPQLRRPTWSADERLFCAYSILGLATLAVVLLVV